MDGLIVELLGEYDLMNNLTITIDKEVAYKHTLRNDT